MHTTPTSSLIAAPFALAICLPGAIGMATTEAPALDQRLLSGGSQRTYEDAFARNIPLQEVARTAYTALTLALFGEAGHDVVIGRDNWLFTIQEFRQPENHVDFPTVLMQTRDRLAAEGIALVPVVVPDKARVQGRYLPRPRGGQLDTRYARVMGVLAAEELPVVDLYSAMTNDHLAHDTFMRTDTHWSPLGAQISAELVAEQTGFAQSGAAEFETTFATPTDFEGDLLRFVETGVFASIAGIPRETIAEPMTVAQGDDMGLFGDVKIDAVLIGTSFSAREDFNFAGFLQQATGLTLVNLAEEGQGPFAPMQSALESGAITELNPTVVFWEIPERYINTRSLP